MLSQNNTRGQHFATLGVGNYLKIILVGQHFATLGMGNYQMLSRNNTRGQRQSPSLRPSFTIWCWVCLRKVETIHLSSFSYIYDTSLLTSLFTSLWWILFQGFQQKLIARRKKKTIKITNIEEETNWENDVLVVEPSSPLVISMIQKWHKFYTYSPWFKNYSLFAHNFCTLLLHGLILIVWLLMVRIWWHNMKKRTQHTVCNEVVWTTTNFSPLLSCSSNTNCYPPQFCAPPIQIVINQSSTTTLWAEICLFLPHPNLSS